MVLNRKIDRRRRLMVDSKSQVGGASVATKKSKKTSTVEASVQTDVRKAYSIGAKRRHQRKVTDLIPKRPLSYSLSIVVFVVLLLPPRCVCRFMHFANIAVMITRELFEFGDGCFPFSRLRVWAVFCHWHLFPKTSSAPLVVEASRYSGCRLRLESCW